jgi:uncharacterized integral membrane protein
VIQKIRIALGAIGLILLASFVIQNFSNVSINFWPFLTFNAPLWIIVLASAGVGVLSFHFIQAYRKSKTPKS